jgi:hypothetical protein
MTLLASCARPPASDVTMSEVDRLTQTWNDCALHAADALSQADRASTPGELARRADERCSAERGAARDAAATYRDEAFAKKHVDQARGRIVDAAAERVTAGRVPSKPSAP